jgi:hypothetical protein
MEHCRYLAGGSAGWNARTDPRHETGVQQAKRVMPEELARLGWQEYEVRARREGQRNKVVIAACLSLTPRFSGVWAMVSASEPLQRFTHHRKPLKRLWGLFAPYPPR